MMFMNDAKLHFQLMDYLELVHRNAVFKRQCEEWRVKQAYEQGKMDAQLESLTTIKPVRFEWPAVTIQKQFG